MDNRPIGVFDSGVGGLSVWSQIYRLLPSESLIYYGDGKNCPYGNKSYEEIERYSMQAAEWLIKEGVKMVVVACNTATAAAIKLLRASYPDIIFVGMEPAVKPAAMATKKGKIAILATRASLEGKLYKMAVSKYSADVDIISATGTGFVELVEANKEETQEAYQSVAEVIEPIIEAGVDKIVLGCTHYPFLLEQIERVIDGRDVEVMDSSLAVARRVGQLLKQNDMEADTMNKAHYRLYTLADDEYLEKLRQKSEYAKGMVLK